jgi:acetyl-CoA C-acetyltransferase
VVEAVIVDALRSPAHCQARGALAATHPVDLLGPVLAGLAVSGVVTKTRYEPARTNGRYGLVTIFCGGGLGTGTLVGWV